MNVIKTAVVSTISLVIAMSAAALSAGPSLAAQAGMDSAARKKAMATPRLPVTGKQNCTTGTLTLTPGVPTDTGLAITFTIGIAKPVALLFSTEIALPAGDTANLDYSIDGAPPVPIGPELFADDPFFDFTTRTAYGVVNAPFNGGVPLKAGKHTITPFLTDFGVGGIADFRCFSVLNTGL